LFVLLVWACQPAPLPAGAPDRPDVIFVSIDTLRADHLGAWGYARDTSPFLDSLASAGTRYADAWSPAPWTLPSHATMLSGVLPSRHGAIESDLALPSDIPWLPEAARAAGYATGGFVSTLFVGERYGFQRGFDAFDDFDIDDEKTNLQATVDAEDVTARARRFLTERAAGAPAFLFLHFYDAHYAYDPPKPWNTRYDRESASSDPKYKNYAYYQKHPLDDAALAHQIAQYDEEIRYVDDTLRAFDAALRAAGREAIWVIVADHGEEFGERGSWGHGHTLWPEQLHVPWILAGPGVPTRVVDARVGLEDVAPTVAALIGVDLPDADGRPRLGAGPIGARVADTSRFDTNLVRWHDPPYDLHLDLRTGARHLCDVAADPTCQTDLAAAHPDEVVRLEAGFRAAQPMAWSTSISGVATSPSGAFITASGVAPRRLALTPGAAFTLLPVDAELAVADSSGVRLGTWAAVGGARPDDGAPVTWSGGGVAPQEVSLDAAQRAQLEALGYVHEEEP
jgi:arylsulfatase A-like enzyme